MYVLYVHVQYSTAVRICMYVCMYVSKGRFKFFFFFFSE